MPRRRPPAIPDPSRTGLAVLTVIATVAMGCADPAAIQPGDIRTYRAALPIEPSPRPGPPGRVAAGITYATPDGWTDRGPSGMRLATLAFSDPLGSQEVTIIRAAGSPEANVARWWGQLDPSASPAETASRTSVTLGAADRVTVGDTEGLIVLLQSTDQGDASSDSSAGGDPEAEVILGGMIPGGATSVFVKFKGPAAAARRAREDFTRLVASIRQQVAAD